jgi:hypothetical protein
MLARVIMGGLPMLASSFTRDDGMVITGDVSAPTGTRARSVSAPLLRREQLCAPRATRQSERSLRVHPPDSREVPAGRHLANVRAHPASTPIDAAL